MYIIYVALRSPSSLSLFSCSSLRTDSEWSRWWSVGWSEATPTGWRPSEGSVRGPTCWAAVGRLAVCAWCAWGTPGAQLTGPEPGAKGEGWGGELKGWGAGTDRQGGGGGGIVARTVRESKRERGGRENEREKEGDGSLPKSTNSSQV